MSKVEELLYLLAATGVDYNYFNRNISQSKRYRCKECGKWVYEESDRDKTCIGCRAEYLEGKNECY